MIEKGGTLREVVVTDSPYVLPNATTATKTDTPVMETPMTVLAIPQQVLQEQGNPSLGQALSNAGVFDNGFEPSAQTLYFRGFKTSATMWNGFRIADVLGGSGDGAVLMDSVERVEVLKGPASILYGRSEPGGMVNVITKQPKDTFHGAVQATVGSWSNQRLAADITGPLNEDKTLLYRLNVAEETSKTYLQYAPEYRSQVIAPVLEWKISPQTSLSVEGQFRHLEGVNYYQAIPIDPATGQLVPVSVSQSQMPDNVFKADSSRLYTNLEHRFNDDWSASWKVMHLDNDMPVSQWAMAMNVYFPVANGQLMIDRYLQRSSMRNKTDATMLDVTGHFSALGIKHTVLAGADYYSERFKSKNTVACCAPTNFYNPTPAPPDAWSTATPDALGNPGWTMPFNWVAQNIDTSLYLQDQMELPGNWHVLLGARYQKFRQTYDSPWNPGTPPTSINTVTPRVGLLWRAQPWLSTYYSYAENFGGANGFDFTGTPLKPETSKQHEVGVKTEWMDGRLTSSLAAFELTKFNIAAADAAHPGFSIPVGEVKSTGFEFNLQGELTSNWNALFNYSHARPLVVQGATGGGILAPANITAGQLLPGVPEKMASVWTSYRLPYESLLGWKVGGGANWVSKSTPWPGSLLTGGSPSRWVASAFAAYETRISGQKTTFQLNVNNLFNKVYYFDQFGAGNIEYVGYGAPRQLKLSAKVEF